jgi:putative aldouronate transport system substrate-binding protein
MPALLCASLILSLGACGKPVGNNAPAGEIGDVGDTGGLNLPLTLKNEEISMFIDTQFDGRENSFAVKELSRRTGIKIKIVETPISSAIDKLKLQIASGNLPDIMIALRDLKEINKIGRQGAFAAVNKYIDKLPNFKKKFVDDPDYNWILKDGAASDGNLYYWPMSDYVRPVNHAFLYRKDIFDKNGIKPWTNTDEFYRALKKLKEIYPDSVPYSSKNGDGIFNLWAFGWGMEGPMQYYDQAEKVWKMGCVDPKYKDMLDFMQKLYNEKLLDGEFLTETQASWIAKMAQPEKSFLTFDWISRADIFYEQVKAENPSYDLRVGLPIGPAQKIFSAANVGVGYGLMVAANKNAELSLKLLDYLTSPSGTRLMTMGVENETYAKDAEGNIKYIGFPEDKVLSINDLEEKYGLFASGLYTRMDSESLYFNYTPKEKEAQEINKNHLSLTAPVVTFDDADQQFVDSKMSELVTTAKEFSTKYILSNYGEKEWNDWLAKAKNLGSDEIIEKYNARKQ